MFGVEESTVEFLGENLPVELLELPPHLIQPLLIGIIHLFQDVRNHKLESHVVRERLYEMMVRVEANLLQKSQFLKRWTVVRARLLDVAFSFNGKFSLERQGT